VGRRVREGGARRVRKGGARHSVREGGTGWCCVREGAAVGEGENGRENEAQRETLGARH
jgi:hypothetical protein